jgi:F-type H+-transporting ATPase subunit b
MPLDAEFWVALAFVLFIGVLGYFGAHRKLLDVVDRRSARIKSEIDEAGQLRMDAESILAAAHLRLQQVHDEAESIIGTAQTAAERVAEETRIRNEEFIARRTRQTDLKIAEAEARAMAEIRSIVADVAIGAAERMLTRTAASGSFGRLLDRDIDKLRSQFEARA